MYKYVHIHSYIQIMSIRKVQNNIHPVVAMSYTENGLGLGEDSASRGRKIGGWEDGQRKKATLISSVKIVYYACVYIH